MEVRWEQAALAEKANDVSLLLDAYYNLGKLYEDAGSFLAFYGPHKAEGMYEKVLDIAGKCDLVTLGEHGANLVKDAVQRLEVLRNGGCVVS